MFFDLSLIQKRPSHTLLTKRVKKRKSNKLDNYESVASSHTVVTTHVSSKADLAVKPMIRENVGLVMKPIKLL